MSEQTKTKSSELQKLQDQKSGKSGGQEQSDQKQQQGGQNQNKIGWPEWITFSIGLVAVIAILSLLTYLHFSSGNGDPRIAVNPQVNQITQYQGKYYLPVQVKNTGGKTAQNVIVQVQLTPQQGSPESLTFQIHFLTQQETTETTLIFNQDPSKGQINIISSYQLP